MDKIYRDNADIAVAFASGKRRNAIAAAAAAISEEVSTPVQSPIARGAGAEAEAEAAVIPAQGTIKQFLRRIARGIYRVVRPLAKPVAYRARGFLMTGQLQQMERLHTETLQKLAITEQALRAEIKEARAMITEEGQNTRNTLTTALIAEMKYTREVLNELDTASQSRVQAEVERYQAQLARIETYAASAARRGAVQCGDSEILVRTAVGYVLCPAQDHALLAQLLDVGDLEAGTRMLIQRVLRPGSSYIDVGANIGMHAVAAARAMQGKGSIVCFEPYEPTACLLGKSLFLNGYKGIVQIHQAAVASRSGSQPLYLGNTSGHHSLFPLTDDIASEAPPVQARVVSLDEVLPPDAHVDLIKIDVEGAELEVLAGASRLLNENPDAGLIVECGVAHLRRAGIQLEEWLGQFQSAGLAWKAIDPDDGHLEAWARERLLESSSVNLFMARANAPVWRLAEGKDE
jgi:FkbM family methyltransferase